MKKIALGLALLLSSFSMPSLAVGWGQTTTITGYYIWAGGTAYIRVANPQNPDNCTNGSYLGIDTTSINFKNIWAQVMAAQASAQTVTLY